MTHDEFEVQVKARGVWFRLVLVIGLWWCIERVWPYKMHVDLSFDKKEVPHV